MGLLVLILIVFLWADPYTHGQIGGGYVVFDRDFHRVPLFRWQIGASILLALLLAFGLTSMLRNWPRVARFTFGTEAGLFIVINVTYVLRDGALTRATIGDERSTWPAIVTLGGLLGRFVILFLAMRRSRPPSPPSWHPPPPKEDFR
jgi:hypothetical protein